MVLIYSAFDLPKMRRMLLQRTFDRSRYHHTHRRRYLQGFGAMYARNAVHKTSKINVQNYTCGWLLRRRFCVCPGSRGSSNCSTCSYTTVSCRTFSTRQPGACGGDGGRLRVILCKLLFLYRCLVHVFFPPFKHVYHSPISARR